MGQRDRVAASVQVALGAPTDGNDADDYWIDEHTYVLSYNLARRVPNWVAWELSAEDLGHTMRVNDFRPEEALPTNIYRVAPRDYEHSGYDRGHMCPSADRTNDGQANASTFLMINMMPQRHALNTGPWEKLEQYERRTAEAREHVFIVAGGIFGGAPATIGHGVEVPVANYKILVAIRGESAADVTTKTAAVAVVMPNDESVSRRNWRDYVTTVDEVERLTGYDFLSAVPEPIAQVIEARVSTELDFR